MGKVTMLFNNEHSSYTHEFPVLLNWTDNTSAKTWLRKAATRTNKGKSLQRLLCTLMINNPVGIKAEHIAGLSNTLTDAISHVYSTSFSQNEWI